MYRIVPDERSFIEDALRAMCDQDACCLVVTTGGTGPAPRDVTPEATETVCSAMMSMLIHPTPTKKMILKLACIK